MQWFHFEEIDSTNEYAKNYIKNNFTQPFVVTTDFQTAGKGQHHKTWQSAKSKNLLLSFCFKPEQFYAGNLHNQFQFLASIALGCRQFLQHYIQEPVKIKWTNDIIVQNKKIGGILIENIFISNDWQYAIVGIGINIHQTHFEELNSAISLKQITKKNYNLQQLYHELVQSIITQLQNTSNYLKEYESYLYKLQEYAHVHFIHAGKDAKVFIKSVLPYGELMINDGQQDIVVQYGSIQWDIS